MITQEELKRQLHYANETGILTWLVSNSPSVKIGDIAGTKRPDGYMSIQINCKRYLSHRLAWLYVYGEIPLKYIDHINTIKDANWILNLREATRSENHFNRGAYKNNTSGFKGVAFHKETNKWVAQAWLNGKKHYLGLFPTPELASEAYQAFAIKHHGEFYNMDN